MSRAWPSRPHSTGSETGGIRALFQSRIERRVLRNVVDEADESKHVGLARRQRDRQNFARGKWHTGKKRRQALLNVAAGGDQDSRAPERPSVFGLQEERGGGAELVGIEESDVRTKRAVLSDPQERAPREKTVWCHRLDLLPDSPWRRRGWR